MRAVAAHAGAEAAETFFREARLRRNDAGAERGTTPSDAGVEGGTVRPDAGAEHGTLRPDALDAESPSAVRQYDERDA